MRLRFGMSGGSEMAAMRQPPALNGVELRGCWEGPLEAIEGSGFLLLRAGTKVVLKVTAIARNDVFGVRMIWDLR